MRFSTVLALLAVVTTGTLHGMVTVVSASALPHGSGNSKAIATKSGPASSSTDSKVATGSLWAKVRGAFRPNGKGKGDPTKTAPDGTPYGKNDISAGGKLFPGFG
ncbi:hypothetical protein BC835DRAFT_667227 [Cytidiella melzeri]|nr:hypothetical protein BC835DRAFT_667227 [Cytidiella melzeri]